VYALHALIVIDMHFEHAMSSNCLGIWRDFADLEATTAKRIK